MKAFARLLLHFVQRFVRTLDLPLLAALLAIMVAGIVVLYSAGNGSPRFAMAQGARYTVGLGAMWLLSRIPPQLLRSLTPALFGVSLVPLVAVLFVGEGKHGNHWIDLGVFYFQPAELLKLTLPMMAAWYLHHVRLPLGFRALLVCAAIVGVPTGLVLLQPDFGTAMLVASSGCFVVYLAGLSWRLLAVVGVGGVVAAGLAYFAPIEWFWMLRPYQQNRILTFRDPDNDPLGAGWNIIQSKIAIGSGGFGGQGWGEGSQSHLDFLPEHTTDFIFAVLAEEFGWLGVAALLALYLFVIGRCLWIAGGARDTYGRLLAGALGLAFSVYVIVNGSMISGLLPVVGVPMPLLSYGGTAAVSLLAGMGVVMAMKDRR